MEMVAAPPTTPMAPFELNLLHALHVASVVILIAFTFFAFAASPETRKSVMIITGVSTLVVLLTGLRMWQGMFSFNLLGWVIVKIVCWIGLSALAGVGYRRRDKAAGLMAIVLLLAVIALVMVYWKPVL